MRILVNAAPCVVGGGAQVAANFISCASRDNRHEFFFVVSEKVKKHLDKIESDIDLLECDHSPSHPWRGRRTRTALRGAEKRFRPDVVFTVFGPAYQQFSVPHVCGFANAWDTHPSLLAIEMLSVLSRWRFHALRKYKKFWLSQRDYYWTESEVSRHGIARLTDVGLDRICVIPNCYSEVFDKQEYSIPTMTSNPLRVFTIGSPYMHKRFPFILDVALELKKQGWKKNILFVVTLPSNGKEVTKFWARASALNVASMIENIGPINLEHCPGHYANSDCVFLPTVLETFSVSYLEAMKARRPIITSDLDFARDVCGEAAEYFLPRSPIEAANAILAVITNVGRAQDLISAGAHRLQHFLSPQEKYEAHIQWLEYVVKSSQSSCNYSGPVAKQSSQPVNFHHV